MVGFQELLWWVLGQAMADQTRLFQPRTDLTRIVPLFLIRIHHDVSIITKNEMSPIAPPSLSAAAKRDIGAPTETNASTPTIFTPLTSRGLKLKNRVCVSPMCQYSATDGVPNGWHLAHLTGFASRGAAVVVAEATSVQPNGRISPEDTGIWNDEQMNAWKAVAELIASQGAIPAIQLAHAGRKASSLSPFNAAGQHTVAATKEQGGWPENVYGPTAEAYSESAAVPKEMSVEEIDALVEDFAKAAERADRARFKIIEIHAAQWVPFERLIID
jgi:hypothetical protein